MAWTLGSLLKRGRKPIKAHKLLLTSTCYVPFPLPQREIAPWNVGVFLAELLRYQRAQALTQVMVVPWALGWFLPARIHCKYRLCHVPAPSTRGHQCSASSRFVQKIKLGFADWNQRVMCSTSSARHRFCLLRSTSLVFSVMKNFVHHLLPIYSLHPLYYKMGQDFPASFGITERQVVKKKFC